MKINKPLAKKPPFFDIDIRTVADIDKDPRFLYGGHTRNALLLDRRQADILPPFPYREGKP